MRGQPQARCHLPGGRHCGWRLRCTSLKFGRGHSERGDAPTPVAHPCSFCTVERGGEAPLTMPKPISNVHHALDLSLLRHVGVKTPVGQVVELGLEIVHAAAKGLSQAPLPTQQTACTALKRLGGLLFQHAAARETKDSSSGPSLDRKEQR